jgi:hypothetical protein
MEINRCWKERVSRESVVVKRLLHRGNPTEKASDKPHGVPELSGEAGRLILLLDKWIFEDKGVVCCWFNRPEIHP